MQRFLISRLSSLGDVACSLPAAVALKRSYPESEITWVVDPRFAGVVECCTAIDHVMLAKPGLNPETWPRLEGEYDAALDLQGLLKSSIPVWRSKAKEKLGYHWQREGSWLFSRRVLPDPTSFHIVDQYVDVARAAGADMHRAEFALEPDPEAVQTVRNKLNSAHRFVVVNPGAAWVTKRWPAESFAHVIDGLAAQGVTSVLIGGRADSDKESAAAVKSQCQSQPIDLVGHTTIKELIALLSLADAHVGGDTGSTHLMAALNKPAIGLYSITRPQRSCPYGQIERCHYDPEGLERIKPGDVLRTVVEALA